MDWGIAANIAGVAALGLAGYTFVSDRLVNRRADIEVRMESRERQTQSHRLVQLVLENHGGHEATDVHVTLLDRQGVEQTGMLFKLTEPLAVLWPGQRYNDHLSIGLGQDVSTARISWKDGRARRQARDVWVSYEYH